MPEDVAVVIDGRRWEAWEDLEIQRSIDNFSTCTFSSIFEPDKQVFRDTFRPFTYKNLQILVDDAPLFTGTLVGVDPASAKDSSTVTCSAFSLPAWLADQNAPASKFPLEFNGLRLSEILARLAEPFGVKVAVEAEDDRPYRRVALEPEQKHLSFLAELARQRNMVITDTPDGTMRFWRPKGSGPTVARLKANHPPLGGVVAALSPQQYYSEITGISRAKSRSRGSRYTVQNPHLGVVRPVSFSADDTSSADLPTAVQAKMARMFGNAAAWVLDELPTWRSQNGALWAPADILTLEAPKAMIYRETSLQVRDAFFRQNGSKTTVRLGVTLPGTFAGEIPTVLPWD